MNRDRNVEMEEDMFPQQRNLRNPLVPLGALVMQVLYSVAVKIYMTIAVSSECFPCGPLSRNVDRSMWAARLSKIVSSKQHEI